MYLYRDMYLHEMILCSHQERGLGREMTHETTYISCNAKTLKVRVQGADSSPELIE